MGRDGFWDSLKFILIFLVVYGHIIETYTPDGTFNQALYNYIYIFHMPFFLFISGRFSQLKDKKKYRKGILLLVETYLVFQIIRCFKPLFLGSLASVNLNILYPKGTMWYIACLIIYRLFVYFFHSNILVSKSLVFIFVSSVFGILWGFLPIHISQKLISYFPFFLMGYFSVKIDIKYICSKIPISCAIGGILFSFLIFYLFVNFDIDYVVYCDRSYYQYFLNVSPCTLCMARCALYISAVLVSLFIMRIILVKEIFPKLGTKTLFVYMYHTFAVLTLRSLIAKGYVMQNTILLFLYAVLLVISLILLSRIKLFNILLNPVSYLIERGKKYINR